VSGLVRVHLEVVQEVIEVPVLGLFLISELYNYNSIFSFLLSFWDGECVPEWEKVNGRRLTGDMFDSKRHSIVEPGIKTRNIK
jgi:hypothetical protein